MLVPDQGIAEW